MQCADAGEDAGFQGRSDVSYLRSMAVLKNDVGRTNPEQETTLAIHARNYLLCLGLSCSLRALCVKLTQLNSCESFEDTLQEFHVLGAFSAANC